MCAGPTSTENEQYTEITIGSQLSFSWLVIALATKESSVRDVSLPWAF